MTEKLFDDFVRDKLKDFPSRVPEDLWGKIITDKEYRPKAFWRLNNPVLIAAIGFVALLTGGYFIYIANNKNTIENNNQAIVSQKNNLSTQKNITDNTNSTLITSDSSKNNNLPADKNTQTKVDNSAVSALNNTKQQGPNNTFPGNKNSVPALAPLNSKKSTISSGNNNIPHPVTLKEEYDMPITRKVSSYAELVKLYPNHLHTLNNLPNPPFNLRSILGLGNDCPSVYGNHQSDWWLEIYASPDYSNRVLAGNGVSNLYLQKKDSTEKMRFGYTVGARISKSVGDHFMLKAGLQYSQINEHFSQRKESETKTVTVIITRTIVRPQGDTTFKDTTSVTQIGYVIKSSRNHYSNFEIPVSIGYEFGQKRDPWRFAVNGGAIFNITSWYSGETIDTAFNVVPIGDSKSSNSFYKKDLSLSLFGSVSLIHNINNNLDVFAEPYFRYSLSNLNNNIGYSQRYNTFGLTLGVRMKLNGRQHYNQ